MPVLSASFSVVVKVESIASRFRGGIGGFTKMAGASFCTDGKLARAGFQSLQEATEFVCLLADRGLSPYNTTTRSAEDMIVSSEARGFAIPCDWAEFGFLDWKGDPTVRVPACRAMDSDSLELAVPMDWQPSEGKTSQADPYVTTAMAI